MALVEVTTVSDGALENESGLNPALNGVMQSYGSISGKLRDIASGKTEQLARDNFQAPRVLIIVSNHQTGHAFLGDDAARELMASSDSVRVTLGGGDPRRATHLKTSVFFRHAPDGGLRPEKRPISGILLIRHDGEDLHLCGLLHPDAVQPMSPNIAPEIPWYCVGNWPCDGGVLEMGFVWQDPRPNPLHPERAELNLFFDADAQSHGLTPAIRVREVRRE